MTKSSNTITAAPFKAEIKNVKQINRVFKKVLINANRQLLNDPGMLNRKIVALSGMDRRIVEARALKTERGW